MKEAPDLEALLIIGAYGTGKTALAAEIAEMLEERGRPYAAIDLDWLAWADTEGLDGDSADRLMLRNLSAVVINDAPKRAFVSSYWPGRIRIDPTWTT